MYRQRISHYSGHDLIRLTPCSLQTLLFTVGPFLVPRLINFYRAQKTAIKTSPVPIQPTPAASFRGLNVLFISALIALISTLPFFTPENIFTVTSSRLQTSNDVLFTRLGLIRPNATLTDSDRLLKPRLTSIDSRCLYFTYGPDVLSNCPFCVSDEPITYFYYALPSILLPHLLHLVALGLATSSAVSGKYGSRWRTYSVIGGVAIACADCYVIGTYNWRANARAPRAEDLDHFFWRMRIFRGIVICVGDAALAALLWATSTNRIFVMPPNGGERMEAAMRVLENARMRLGAVGIVRNVLVRDEGLRKKGEAYWLKERQVMGEVMDEAEVVEGIRNALSERINMTRVEDDARNYAEGIVAGPHFMNGN